MKTLRQTYTIAAPAKLVWQALTDPAMIEEWGGGPAKMSAIAEDDFSLWGGEILGKNKEVVFGEKLVQEWKDKKWKEFSAVTFTLKEEAGKTRLDVFHEGIPDEEVVGVDDGWREYYLEPLKKLVEEMAESEN